MQIHRDSQQLLSFGLKAGEGHVADARRTIDQQIKIASLGVFSPHD